MAAKKRSRITSPQRGKDWYVARVGRVTGHAMRRRRFISVFGSAMTWRTIAAYAWAVTSPISARAQADIKRIGFLRIGPPPSAWIEALRQGLRELGYTEGQNISFEFGLAPDVAQLA